MSKKKKGNNLSVAIRRTSYPDEFDYVYQVAEARQIKSKANALAIIIREHKQLTPGDTNA